MQFRIPGTQLQARLFESVATTDSQYNIYDIGIQHNNGDIDSVAVGGSFATAKNWVKTRNEQSDQKAAEQSADNTAPAAA